MYVNGIYAIQNALLTSSVISNLAGTQQIAAASQGQPPVGLGPAKDGHTHTHSHTSFLPKRALHHRRYLSRSEILQLRPGPDDKLCKLPDKVWNILKTLDLCRVKKGRSKRGKRGGRKHNCRPPSTNPTWAIETIISPFTTRILPRPQQCSGYRPSSQRNLNYLVAIQTTCVTSRPFWSPGPSFHFHLHRHN